MLKNFILDCILPRYCLNCQNELASDSKFSHICIVCFDKIRINSRAQCDAHNLRNLKKLFFAGWYDDPILKEMIHLFKYQPVESLKRPIAELIVNYLKKEKIKEQFFSGGAFETAIAPVPLALGRKITRGFNQSELLAKEISDFLQMPMLNLLKRKYFKTPQAEIADWKKRQENVAGVFEARAGRAPLNGIKKIILVDDVSTSGATLNEAAGALKTAGIKEIYGLVAAKR